jgi:hypothetical protein
VIFFKKQKNISLFLLPLEFILANPDLIVNRFAFHSLEQLSNPSLFKFDLSFTNSQGAGGCRLDGPNGQRLLIPGLSFPT